MDEKSKSSLTRTNSLRSAVINGQGKKEKYKDILKQTEKKVDNHIQRNIQTSPKDCQSDREKVCNLTEKIDIQFSYENFCKKLYF